MYVQGKTEDEDLFDLASLVSGIREELRWKQSLAKDEKMRKLIEEVSFRTVFLLSKLSKRSLFRISFISYNNYLQRASK